MIRTLLKTAFLHVIIESRKTYIVIMKVKFSIKKAQKYEIGVNLFPESNKMKQKYYFAP